MSFFPNATGADVRGGTFINVGRDQIYNIRSDKPDLNEILTPVTDAAYNRRGPVARCYPGTREDVIAKIVGWVDGDEDRPICWLNGPAGSGKSAISQTIAERYAAEGRLAANFFFLRGAGERSTIARLIPTLSYQLSVSTPTANPLIQEALRIEPGIIHQSLRYQLHKLFVEPILVARKPILSILSRRRSRVVVIDALDECDDKYLMAEFIEVIISAFSENPGPPFRFFITSRVEEHIRQKLGTSMARSVVHHLSLQDFDARVDIHAFFRFSFSTIYEENQRVMRNIQLPWPSESDLNTLVNKSDGLFIFAVTLMDFIRKGMGHPQAKLQKALWADAGLDDLYTRVLSDAPRDHNFNRVIATVMLLHYPISINFLGDLLRLNAGEIVQTLLGVQSILMIPGDDDQAIRLFHTSLRDFLIQRLRSGDFFINPPACHLCIAADCLSVICKPPENDIVYKGGQKYACLNWYYHLRQALLEGQGDDFHKLLSGMALMCSLDDFMPLSFDFWVNTTIYNGDSGGMEKTLPLVLSSLNVGPIF